MKAILLITQNLKYKNEVWIKPDCLNKLNPTVE